MIRKLSSEVKKVDFSEKTKNINFPTFCEILNQEAGVEVDKQVAKQFYQENQEMHLRTAISKAISAISQQAIEANLEEWHGVALGMRDFTYKDQEPENLKQVWISFIKEDGKIEELKCWGTHINNQKMPFGALLELKGAWNKYTSPKTKQTYNNWIPHQMKILKELTRDERIKLCEKSYIPIEKFTKDLIYSSVIGFGVIGRVVNVTRFTNSVKDGSYELLQRKRDGADTYTFSVLLKTQGENTITIDFEPQQLANFYFDIIDFEEIMRDAIQTNNQIKELSNALNNRKVFYIGNYRSTKRGLTKQRESRTFIRIRGTALIETDEFPKGYVPPKADQRATSLPAKSEETKTQEQIGYYKQVIPLMQAIAKLDTGTGVKVEDIQKEMNIPNPKLILIINDAINTGDIYQPNAGKYRLLGSIADIQTYEKTVQSALVGNESLKKEEIEEEEEAEEKQLGLVEKVIQRLLSDPKKWFDIKDLADLSNSVEELKVTLGNLKADKTISKAKDKEMYRLKISVDEAKKIVGTPPPQTKPEERKQKQEKADYTKDAINTIHTAIETLGKNTTAEAIRDSGLLKDDIPLEVIQKLLHEAQKK